MAALLRLFAFLGGAVAFIWLDDPFPASGGPIGASFLAGFGALFLLFALGFVSARPSRLPPFDGKFFLNFHRGLAIAMMLFLALHIGLFLWNQPVSLDYFRVTAPWYMLAGVMAAVALLLCFGESATVPLLKALHPGARAFRACHGAFALAAMGLASFHAVAARDHVDDVGKTLLVMSCGVAAVAVCVVRRFRRVAAVRRSRVPERLPALLTAGLAGLGLLTMLVVGWQGGE